MRHRAILVAGATIIAATVIIAGISVAPAAKTSIRIFVKTAGAGRGTIRARHRATAIVADRPIGTTSKTARSRPGDAAILKRTRAAASGIARAVACHASAPHKTPIRTGSARNTARAKTPCGIWLGPGGFKAAPGIGALCA